jgi:N-acyl-D-aspartate/D-glutamate deacylase
MTHDLVVMGGTVVDGTGAPPRTADVAVTNGTITEVGRIEGAARHVIDADGALVTPGFVDLHTHYDGQATWDPHLTPSCWHGVTTAIMGNCGVGFAPVEPGRREWLIELMEGVEDIPGTALSEGIRWSWEDFDGYLDALDAMPRAIDVGAQVPHAAVRAHVMGDRAQEPSTADDVARMRALVRRAMQDGALGLSTGRTAGHRDAMGAPVPGTFAAEAELEALLGALGEVGRGVFQVVPAGISGAIGGDPAGAMERELEWILRLGCTTGTPITFLVMDGGADHNWRPWFERVRSANRDGANIRPQVASRCFGMLFGLQSAMNPFRFRASYRAVEHLPLHERVARLREPDVRTAVLSDPPELTGPPRMDQFTEHLFDRLFPLGAELDYEPPPERSIAALAATSGRDPWSVLYDAFLDDDGRSFVLHPMMNFGQGSYSGLHEMLTDPLTVQGLGDGGAHCSMICDASMTTYLLSHWVRDRTRGPRIDLSEAVRRLTSDPAALYGLHDRGVVEPGRKADLNVIDLDNVGLEPPQLVHDLPAGAARLVQRSRGYVATLVAGRSVVLAGELTDERPGALVRGGR